MISEPVDYSMTPAQTLAHGADVDLPEGFDAFWGAFRDEVETLPRAWRGRIDAEENRLIIASVRGVRVVARLRVPEGPIRGILLTTHGSDTPDDFPEAPEPWAEEGLATMRLRVRGFPPSTMDIDDVRRDWIMHHLESPQSWIVRGAVADVIQAWRCVRSHFGPEMPLAMHGESLGGGLVTIASAQLTAMGDPPARLVIALPTFGDWRWRSEQYCNGTGAFVNELLVSMRDDRDALLEKIRLFDAALHAAQVQCPVLCKLAVRDDVVPAPSAAAVFNAIGSARKWRFVTRFGHYDGGIGDLRRHLQFEHLQARFVNPDVDPAALMTAEASHLDLQDVPRQ